jgi:hypothetical protein
MLPMQVYNPPLESRRPGRPPSTFFALMVGASGSPTSHHRGSTVDVFCIDGARFRIFDTTSLGAHCRRFLVLIVDAPESPTPPPKGPTVDVS